MKKHATTVAMVALGVLVAGIVMSQLRDLPGVEYARDGFQ